MRCTCTWMHTDIFHSTNIIVLTVVVLWCGGVVLWWCGVMWVLWWCGVMWCCDDVVWCGDVVLWCDWCDVMMWCCDVMMWCCDVMLWCDAQWCGDVMGWCEVIMGWCEVIMGGVRWWWVMWCDVMLWRCDNVVLLHRSATRFHQPPEMCVCSLQCGAARVCCRLVWWQGHFRTMELCQAGYTGTVVYVCVSCVVCVCVCRYCSVCVCLLCCVCVCVHLYLCIHVFVRLFACCRLCWCDLYPFSLFMACGSRK